MEKSKICFRNVSNDLPLLCGGVLSCAGPGPVEGLQLHPRQTDPGCPLWRRHAGVIIVTAEQWQQDLVITRPAEALGGADAEPCGADVIRPGGGRPQLGRHIHFVLGLELTALFRFTGWAGQHTLK